MNLEKYIYEYPTSHKEGFTCKELDEIISKFPDMNNDKFNDAMRGNTCLVKDGDVVMYHCDILIAIRCGLENRDISFYEWD